MTSKNTVTLTFAGDSKSLERTFDNVGAGAKKMGGNLDKASGEVTRFGSGVDNMNDKVDQSERKFMGAADLLDGLGGAFGLPLEGATSMARSFADLAGGFTNLLGPAIKGALTKIGVLTTATTAEAVATEGAAAAQTSLNVAFLANPIGLWIAGIVALGAALVLGWKNSETFRDIVKGAFNGIMTAFNVVKDGIVTGVRAMGDVFIGVGKVIATPYIEAFKLIKSLWNSTLGGFGFDFGGWDPPGPGKFPGFSFKIPSMHSGGTVPGSVGAEVPIMALAGETVIPRGQAPAAGPQMVQVFIDGRQIHQSLLRLQRTSGPLGLA